MKNLRRIAPGGTASPARALGFGGVFVLIALLFASIAPPGAEARIYWTNLSAGTVGSARMDGSGIRKGFIRGLVNPFGLAANGRHLFWADKNTGNIGRARLDGRGVSRDFVRIPAFWTPAPIGVSVKGKRLYWTSGGTFIGRARIDGKRPNRRFITTRKSGPIDVAVKGKFVYWVNSNTNSIGRARLDGTRVKRNFIRTGNGVASAVAIAGCHIYWADYWTGKIGRANLDGTGVRRSLIDTGSVRGALRGLAVVR